MSARRVPIGKIVGLFGVAGWVKVRSYTRPPHNAADYPDWSLAPCAQMSGSPAFDCPAFEAARVHHGGVVAKFRGVDDRTAAAALVGREVAVEETRFADLPPGEYYWFQLVGLEVVNTAGRVLGRVKRLLETGANDVLVVEGGGVRHLIPYVGGDYVKAVDLKNLRIEVEWREEWRA